MKNGKLKYTKAPYGPFCANLHNAIDNLSGYYITGLKDEYLGGGTTGSSIKYASLNNLRLSFDYSRYMAEELNGTLEIPNKINNTKIIGIESDAFIKIRNLKKVIMQNGIIVIRGFAFSGMSSVSRKSTMLSGI